VIDRSDGRDGTRAVSITTGFILNMGIATVVTSLLLFSLQGPFEDIRESTKETQLEVTGERIVANLEAADRLERRGGTGEIPLDQPDVQYRAELSPGTNSVVLTSDRARVNLSYTGENDLPDAEFSPSQDVDVVYDNSSGELRIE